MMKKVVAVFILLCACVVCCCTSVLLSESVDDEEFVVFEENSLFGVKDAKGNILVLPVYNEISGFCNGYSCVYTDSGVGLINSKGKLIAPCKFDSITIPEDGFYVTLLDDEQSPRYEFYSADGTPTGWCFEYASGFHDGYACVIFQGEEYLLDIAGELHSIAPFQFAWGDGFSEKRLLVEKDGRYGYLDSSLKLVIPCIYDWAEASFNDGTAAVRLNGKLFYIDKSGKKVE